MARAAFAAGPAGARDLVVLECFSWLERLRRGHLLLPIHDPANGWPALRGDPGYVVAR